MASGGSGPRGQGSESAQLRARTRARPPDDHSRMRVDASKPVAPRARRHEHLAGCQKVARRAIPLPIESIRAADGHEPETRTWATSRVVRSVLVGPAEGAQP